MGWAAAEGCCPSGFLGLPFYFGYQALHLVALRCSDRKQGEAWIASVEAIEVSRIFHAGDAQLIHNLNAGNLDAPLFLIGEFVVVVFMCGVDLIAGRGCAGGECEDATNCSCLEQCMKLLG